MHAHWILIWFKYFHRPSIQSPVVKKTQWAHEKFFNPTELSQKIRNLRDLTLSSKRFSDVIRSTMSLTLISEPSIRKWREESRWKTEISRRWSKSMWRKNSQTRILAIWRATSRLSSRQKIPTRYLEESSKILCTNSIRTGWTNCSSTPNFLFSCSSTSRTKGPCEPSSGRPKTRSRSPSIQIWYQIWRRNARPFSKRMPNFPVSPNFKKTSPLLRGPKLNRTQF